VLDSKFRDITGPVLDYVAAIRGAKPRDLVVVYLPEYVVGHWWEQLLHNQSALRLKARLLFQPGVMVTNVPWQLGSAARHAPASPAPVGRRLGTGVGGGKGRAAGARLSSPAAGTSAAREPAADISAAREPAADRGPIEARRS
jgi:hypothetical protein